LLFYRVCGASVYAALATEGGLVVTGTEP